MDVNELHRRAVEGFAALVERVPGDRWDAPTPCAAWTVRDIVNHLVNEQRWTAPMFAGATIEEVGDRFDGDLLGADPVGAVRAWAQPGHDVRSSWPRGWGEPVTIAARPKELLALGEMGGWVTEVAADRRTVTAVRPV